MLKASYTVTEFGFKHVIHSLKVKNGAGLFFFIHIMSNKLTKKKKEEIVMSI